MKYAENYNEYYEYFYFLDGKKSCGLRNLKLRLVLKLKIYYN